MNVSVELNAELNDIIDRYESQIAQITETEEVRDLKRARNRVIIACLLPIRGLLDKAGVKLKTQDDAVAAACHLHDPLSVMSLETIQRTAGEMLSPTKGTFVTEGKMRRAITLIVNLTARLKEHIYNPAADAHPVGGVAEGGSDGR